MNKKVKIKKVVGIILIIVFSADIVISILLGVTQRGDPLIMNPIKLFFDALIIFAGIKLTRSRKSPEVTEHSKNRLTTK